VSLTAALIVLSAVLQTPGDGAMPTNIRYWAVEATKENRDTALYERGVEAARDALSALPFDTFRAVNTGWKATKAGESAEFKIDNKYTLRVKPEIIDSGDRVRLDIVVMIQSADPAKPPVKALETRISTTPGKQLSVCGLKLQNGHDLIIVLDASH